MLCPPARSAQAKIVDDRHVSEASERRCNRRLPAAPILVSAQVERDRATMLAQMRELRVPMRSTTGERVDEIPVVRLRRRRRRAVARRVLRRIQWQSLRCGNKIAPKQEAINAGWFTLR
jgi:hypothetical protein